MNIDIKTTLKISILVLCALSGLCFARIYQNKIHSVNIYKQALEDYNNKNYQNSFYLFSKIGHLSHLKPASLYRQAISAQAIGDTNSELNCYLKIINNYPASRLANDAKYNAAQLLIEKNPSKAKKLFSEILNSDMSKDYKYAAEAYISIIKINTYVKNNTKPDKANLEEIEKGLRKYLNYAPNGRLAIKISKLWTIINENITPKDKTLIAKAYYYAGLYDEAENIFQQSDITNSWAVRISNYIALNKLQEANALIELGVSQYSNNVKGKEYEKAVYDLLKTKDNYYSYTSRLFSIAKEKNKDFIWNLKCKYSPESEQNFCYSSLYSNFPQSKYAPEALSEIIINDIINKNYTDAKKLSNEFIEKFPDSELNPMIKFWLGKIEQKSNNSEEAKSIYKSIINDYPDSYYAYRAFWILNKYTDSVVVNTITPKKIVFPVTVKDKVITDLIALKDYDLIEKYAKNEFVTSWVQYKKGLKTTSIYTAQKGMAKLKKKPNKKDPRWRLIYPLHYYDTIQYYTNAYNNDTALILAIIREESHFDEKAGSSAGAMGLMQIMPQTALDIANKNNIDISVSDLLLSETNIKLGNLYYKTIHSLLNNRDISAIAAYNGGIGSVQRWKSNILYSDTDEFVEQIPYTETRGYVKKVFSSYWNYTRIYE